MAYAHYVVKNVVVLILRQSGRPRGFTNPRFRRMSSLNGGIRNGHPFSINAKGELEKPSPLEIKRGRGRGQTDLLPKIMRKTMSCEQDQPIQALALLSTNELPMRGVRKT